jgi:hypothetical protein
VRSQRGWRRARQQGRAATCKATGVAAATCDLLTIQGLERFVPRPANQPTDVWHASYRRKTT